MRVSVFLLFLVIPVSIIIPVRAESLEYVELPMQYYGQNNDFLCCPASAQMVLRYIKRSNQTLPMQFDLAQEMNTLSGTSIQNIVKPFHRRGFTDLRAVATKNHTGYTVASLSIDYLKKQLQNGYPFIAAGHLSAYSVSISHCVVVIGYDERGPNKQIIILDPAGEGRRTIDYATFETRWSDSSGTKYGVMIPYKGA